MAPQPPWPFVLALVVPMAPLSAIELHVSPAGSDSNPGTAQRPLRTPSAARHLLRHSSDAAKTVVLHAGTHAPLVLSAADSGTAASPVRWKGLPGATISAGVVIPKASWRPGRPTGVLVANLSAIPGVPSDLGTIEAGSLVDGCVNNRSELFVGEQRMVLARYPNMNVTALSPPSSGWSPRWLHANGDFNHHDSYCKGENATNVTGPVEQGLDCK